MLPGTYEELNKSINLGGIASGLEIMGKGKTTFELISTEGKKITLIREAYYAPGLPVDLVPPQKLMRTSTDGWSKMNGEKAQLEFRDGKIVSLPFDPVTSLPMLYSFENVDKAAEQLETSLYSCISEESNQNLSRAKKEMLRWHWKLGHPGM